MHDDRDISEFRITAEHLVELSKSGASHKYDHGHAVVVSGPSGQSGAARLSARGALRIGAGLVTVLSPQSAKAEHAARLDAIMLRPYADDVEFTQSLTILAPGALCIGPNLGLDGESADRVSDALRADVPLCLDADALTLLARGGSRPVPWNPDRVVMTPHAGELRRLIPDAFEASSDRVSLARTAARTWECCVLVKGPDTIVARPDGACMIVKSEHFEHAPWLATAGSGDVLSGFVTGLMARGFATFDAAALAAHLHLRCAQMTGPGLIAEDLPDVLPHVLADCLRAAP